jgi:hypothetical protein
MKSKKNKPIRPVAVKTKPDPSLEGFNPVIENFLPEITRGRKLHIKKRIEDDTRKLQPGQSFFIPHKFLGSETVKITVNKILKTERISFKNRDIRIVRSNKSEVKGCRVARFS